MVQSLWPATTNGNNKFMGCRHTVDAEFFQNYQNHIGSLNETLQELNRDTLVYTPHLFVV